jgi:hypothetical protein
MYIFALFHINLISAAVSLDLCFDFTVQAYVPYSNTGRADVVYNFIRVPFWTYFGLKVLLMSHVIFKKVVILLSIYFSFSYDKKFPK